ncbi:MAG: hypothetical protein ACRDZ4_10265 [Egibacteraceae bacterium]
MRSSVPPAFVLPFAVQPDLAATMEIQIPALAWQPATAGRFRRVYYFDGRSVPVKVAGALGALHFFYDAPDQAAAARLEAVLRQTFPEMIGDLDLDRNSILRALRDRYRGVIVMHTDPFEALVLTILSQNRTGEIVRKVFPALAACCGGVTPGNVAALDLAELTERIRSAGPYKAAPPCCDCGQSAHRRRGDLPQDRRGRPGGACLSGVLPGCGAQDRSLRAGVLRPLYDHPSG